MTGSALRRLRLERGLTQEQLAHLAGTTGRSVHRIETGGGSRPAMKARLAGALGVAVTDAFPELRCPVCGADVSGLVAA